MPWYSCYIVESDIKHLKSNLIIYQTTINFDWIYLFRKQLKELEGKCSIPSLTVGVVGTTGTGKSSLLNAMIDEYNVLPTSGTQACTAVVVKIQNNYKNDLYYEADIEFLSTEVICIKQLKKWKWLNSLYCYEFAVTRTGTRVHSVIFVISFKLNIFPFSTSILTFSTQNHLILTYFTHFDTTHF